VLRSDPNALVVIYSAADDDSTRDRALRAGAAEFLRVPLDAALLRERIVRLGARAARESLRARPVLQRAIVETIQARAAQALAHAQGDEKAAAHMLERAARTASRSAFFESGGTAAYFRRWWEDDFASAWAAARDETFTGSRKRAGE
jgi:DNA-binding NarL/FixJ family response regulator